MKISTLFTKSSDNFSGNVLKLVSASALAQALGILVSPIVTRLFAPEAYGVAALFASIVGILTVIVCLRYELAIMLPKTSEEAANVLGVCLCSVLFVTVLTVLIVSWGDDQLIRLTNAPGLKTYLWLIPVSVFLTGIYLALNYWNSRTKHFGRLSLIQIISAVTTQATKLSAGFAGFVSGGVLIGTGILGNAVSSGALAGQIWRDDKRLFIQHVRWKGIVEGFIRYRKFLIIDTWGGLLNSISWQLPALMLSSFFSISVVGFYALGLTVVKAPLNIMAGAVSQVFYQKACDEKNIQGSNGELVEKLMDKLMFIGILPIMILTMIGEELFTVIFGQRWFEAGRYTQILAPWIFFWFISSPLSILFSVYERQGSALSVHIIIFITRVASLYIGGIYQSVYLALGLFSTTGIAAYAFVAAWNIRLAKASARKICSTFIKYFLYALPVCGCIYLIKFTFQLEPTIIIISAISLMVIHYLAFRSKLTELLKV